MRTTLRSGARSVILTGSSWVRVNALLDQLHAGGTSKRNCAGLYLLQRPGPPVGGLPDGFNQTRPRLSLYRRVKLSDVGH